MDDVGFMWFLKIGNHKNGCFNTNTILVTSILRNRQCWCWTVQFHRSKISKRHPGDVDVEWCWTVRYAVRCLLHWAPSYVHRVFPNDTASILLTQQTSGTNTAGFSDQVFGAPSWVPHVMVTLRRGREIHDMVVSHGGPPSYHPVLINHAINQPEGSQWLKKPHRLLAILQHHDWYPHHSSRLAVPLPQIVRGFCRRGGAEGRHRSEPAATRQVSPTTELERDGRLGGQRAVLLKHSGLKNSGVLWWFLMVQEHIL